MKRILRMRLWSSAWLGLVWLLLVGLSGHEADADDTKTAAAKTAPLKTTFAEKAKLSPAEIKEVRALARRCGLTNLAEIRTFQYLPVGGNGVEVINTSLIQGRDRRFVSLIVNKVGWSGGPPDGHSIRTKHFWANPEEKSFQWMRSYTVNRQSFEVAIGSGITTNVADVAIPYILNEIRQRQIQAAQPVQPNQSLLLLDDWNEFKSLKPYRIGRSDMEKGQYELTFNEGVGRGLFVIFKIEHGKIQITGTGSIVV